MTDRGVSDAPTAAVEAVRAEQPHFTKSEVVRALLAATTEIDCPALVRDMDGDQWVHPSVCYVRGCVDGRLRVVLPDNTEGP